MAGRFAGARMGANRNRDANAKNLRNKSKARSKSGSQDPVAKGKGTPSKSSKGSQKVYPPKACPSKLKPGKKGKKGKHQQYELIVTIDLVEYGLTDDLVAEFKEAFMLFDKDEDGMITTGELGVVMRSLGQRPSDHELRKLVAGIATCADGTIEFNEFLQMMSKKLKHIGNEDDLKEAFKVFDKDNTGYLKVTELRHVMTSMGEKMTEQEVEDMVKEACPNSDGRVKYEDFVNLIARKH